MAVGLGYAAPAYICAAILGENPTFFNNANAYIGVGDSTTAYSSSQTDLVAATNKLRKAMDATFPTRATNAMTFQSTFGLTDANYAWQEVGIFNASSAGTMLTRENVSLGTKPSTQQWVLTVTITLS
jgi:hypothetical protein